MPWHDLVSPLLYGRHFVSRHALMNVYIPERLIYFSMYAINTLSSVRQGKAYVMFILFLPDDFISFICDGILQDMLLSGKWLSFSRFTYFFIEPFNH